MFEAKASAGGSVMLPASKPLRSMKFIFKTARANMPMSMSGSTVTHAPASSHCKPVALKTVAKNFSPAPKPTAAKKSAMPNSRKARFVFTGMCQTWRPMRPTRPRMSATIRGPPARPSLIGCGSPGKAMGSVPSAMPRVMPMKNGMKCVSLSSLSELPTAVAALSRFSGHTDNLRLVAKLQAQAGHRGHLEVGAGDARDGDAEAVIEVEFADGLAEHVAIGDDDAAESERAVGEDEVFVAVPANDALKLIEPRAHADDGETVV